MKTILLDFYRFVLRTQAVFGMSVAAIYLANLPASLARNDDVLIPTLLAVSAMAIGYMAMSGRGAPEWLHTPGRRAHLVPMLGCIMVAPFLYSMLGVYAAMSFGLSDLLSRNAVILATAPAFALNLLMALSGGLLAAFQTSESGDVGLDPYAAMPNAAK